MKSSNKKLLISLLITICFITTGAIFCKVGKDEVFYLCGNFSAGEMKSSVVRQLDTTNLSSYMYSVNESGSTIVFNNRLFFVTNQCVIEFDKSEKVVLAGFK
ncbi:hypothetical protein [Pseudoalteromonas aurantia]|uniref:Transmembrane protein n=1 Tax=Pseudoalteromonas aurantia TaxID=43654 RepID=A0ABY2VUI1_9GAMM|nr:hypothetical protein [Pseudoalteromonas aurantia]TMO56530.1 hypothetical protein CWC18_19475 [Pseudoalteromonas aurantia]TMO71928.1 hypothetical protein CWC20_16370 [Pseudoalteromonas aurantia]